MSVLQKYQRVKITANKMTHNFPKFSNGFHIKTPLREWYSKYKHFLCGNIKLEMKILKAFKQNQGFIIYFYQNAAIILDFCTKVKKI